MKGQWQIQGRDLGGAPTLYLDQMRPEGPKKFFFETALTYLRVWMTPSPLSEGLDPPLKGDFDYIFVF